MKTPTYGKPMARMGKGMGPVKIKSYKLPSVKMPKMPGIKIRKKK